VQEHRETATALRESNERIRDLAATLITAQEEERKRIARDLHDDLNQQVAAVAIGLSVLKRWLPKAPGAGHDQVLSLQAKVSDIADRIRELSHELHSSALEHVGLSAALASLCAEFRDGRGLLVKLETRGDLEAVPPDAELCLYRVAQESLRNIAQHSGSARANVVLSATAGAVRLVVRDGGVGFDRAAARLGGGMGLVSMEERVRALGGRFSVTGEPGRGTKLVAEIPLEKVSHD
jgi:two-component system sensor histidine kinase UhpB